MIWNPFSSSLTVAFLSFFLTLLTAFLGHHTDWLDVLGPPNHRRKHQRQQQASGAQIEECAVPTRTVIIANDKICARKLIYLLSAFLPAKNLPSWTTPDAAVLPNRASSTNMVSQSPPAMSYMRNGSLRRRPRKRPSKLSMIHPENEEVRGWDIPVGASAAETVHEPTQASSLQLAMTAVGSLKKSNIVPLTPVVVAAASKDSDSQQKESRPGSSGSSASFSLMHTLKRSGTGHASNDSSGTGTSGWGSFLSGIWSNPKSSSTTATSEASTHLDDAIDCPPPSRSSMRNVLSEKYEDEILVEDHDLYPAYEESFHIQSPPTFDRSLHSFSRSSTAETPLGVSVGEDGVINVEIPMGPSSHLFNPSMVGTSTANTSSPIGSPSSNGFSFSLPSLDRSSTTSSTMFPLGGIEQSDNLMNVAGWMDDERFHPDFSLQAVKPYFEVEADIKRAMRAEPTPVTRNATDATADSLVPGKWVEVCSVLVADTRACRIKRLRLKRRKNAFQFQCFNTDSTVMVGFENGSRGNENSESQMKQEEEEIIEEEWVMDMDDTLVTATERAIGVHDIYQPASNKNQAKSVLSKDTAAPTANFNSNATAAASTESTKSSAGDCKSLLLGALEEVVNKCVTDRTGFVENVLTEGVVKWLNDVEEAY